MTNMFISWNLAEALSHSHGNDGWHIARFGLIVSTYVIPLPEEADHSFVNNLFSPQAWMSSFRRSWSSVRQHLLATRGRGRAIAIPATKCTARAVQEGAGPDLTDCWASAG